MFCRLSSWNVHRVSLSRSLSLVPSDVSHLTHVAPADARVSELRHYMQREADALALAEDVVKQLEGISSLDQQALAEVPRCFNHFHCWRKAAAGGGGGRERGGGKLMLASCQCTQVYEVKLGRLRPVESAAGGVSLDPAVVLCDSIHH